MKFILDIGIKPVLENGKSILQKCLSDLNCIEYTKDFQPFTDVLELLLKKDGDLKNIAIFDLLDTLPNEGNVHYTNEVCVKCISVVLNENPDLSIRNKDGKTSLQALWEYSNSDDADRELHQKLYSQVKALIKEHMENRPLSKEELKLNNDNEQKYTQSEILNPKKYTVLNTKTLASIGGNAQKNHRGSPLSKINNARVEALKPLIRQL